MSHPHRERPASRLELLSLLFAAGIGIGLVFPLSKFATISKVPPLTYIGLSAAGASLVLFVLARLTGNPVRLSTSTIRYSLIAGALTYAIPFGMLTFVVAHLGSGIPAVLQSLTPMLTLVLVSILRMEKLGPRRLAGLTLGLAGVLMIIASRYSFQASGSGSIWLAAAFVTPLALACGNVFRSYAWPPGESSVALAALTFGAAAMLMLGLEAIVLAAAGNWHTVSSVAGAWPIILAQSVASGLGYYFFFRLQQAGGPIYLSQISYVNTTVGVVFAALLFGETIGTTMIFAMILIFGGIALVNFGTQTRQNALPGRARA
jgi:drug/metabolite transporter (DMT)-like permease